jgi:hypothetical protein
MCNGPSIVRAVTLRKVRCTGSQAYVGEVTCTSIRIFSSVNLKGRDYFGVGDRNC